jgi:hypothetical protein
MMPAEDSIIAESERRREGWRSSGVDVDAMLATEREMAARALATLKEAYEYLAKKR